VSDIIFAFDPALDRPIPAPEGAPVAIVEAIATAPAEAVAAAAAEARRSGAAALVLCGRILDPRRASPAQAAAFRRMVVDLATNGCRTIVVDDDTAACHEVARMLGEPQGLAFVTAAAPLRLDIRGLAVELVSAHGPVGAAVPADADSIGTAPLHRRIVIGWDTALWHADRWAGGLEGHHDGHHREAAGLTPTAFAAAAAASPAWSEPGAFWIWGSRRRQHLPVGVHHLPALQERSGHETVAGSCCGLTLLDRDDTQPAAGRRFAAPLSDWRASWREIPTHRVAWRTVTIESPAGGDEELATAIWAALEGVGSGGNAALEIVRCSIECGTSVARRVRVAEIAAETLARLRQLYDPKTFRVWCREVFASPGESLAALGHARSGGRPGTTTSFSSALADIVAAIEQSPTPAIPPDLAREAGWLALELVESS